MKALFLAPQPFFRDRGTPIRTLRQLEKITAMGHRVDLLCYPFGTHVEMPGLRIIRSPRAPGIRDVAIGPSMAKVPMDLLMLWRAWRLCRKERYDVIQAVEEAAFFGAILARRFGCRFVYNLDSHLSDQLLFTGFLTEGVILRIVERMERRTLRRADYAVTVGPMISGLVRALAPSTAVIQLEDAPFNERFEEDREGAARLRDELAIGDAPVALYAGNFKGYQGLDILAYAAGVVARQRPDIRIVLAGGAPRDVARIRALTDEVGAARTCVFAGRRPASEMAAFTSMARVFLVPRSRGTNPPLKLYPAMQSGRPIVATRVPSNTQILDDSCAFLADPEPEAFAREILRAFGDAQESARRADEARRRLQAHYSLADFYGKVAGLYEALEHKVRGQ